MVIRPAVAIIATTLVLLATTCAAEAPLSLVAGGDLVFGRFVAGTGGTLTVAPNGSATAAGAVFIPASSVASAASFAVSGEPDFIYVLTLPSDGQVSLTGSAGAMVLNGFSSSIGALGQLNSAGTQSLSIGATLIVAGAQPPGAYAGSFSIMVEYN